MELEIKKIGATIGFDYIISKDGEEIYTAIAESLGDFSSISFQEKDKIKPIATIKKKLLSWKGKYVIRFSKTEKYDFITKSLDKMNFQLLRNSELYDIYYHKKGRKASIYKNGIQVCWWLHETKKYQGPDLITMKMNYDEDEILLCILFLIIDDRLNRKIMRSGDMDNLATINLDRFFAKEAKQFNPNWIPKDSKS